MSWVKIPCILNAMISLQIAVTPPHPPPPICEQLSTPFEAVLRQRWGPVVVKCLCWSTALLEMTAIYASHFAHHPGAQKILAVLVVNGRIDEMDASPLFFVGIALTLLGASLRYWCYRELGPLFTFEASIRPNHTLVQTGPYRYVRHPATTGLLLTISGYCCWNTSRGSWLRECGALHTWIGLSLVAVYGVIVLCITTGLVLRMSLEDRALAGRFEEWDNYSRRVTYKLVPGVF
ncbi:hypothetical protein FB45DRAFT_893417 [Roridomyces roridus]|uniref:Protein-S-isoprenylcysteine O-methyltransferase n=1 Tax=Roridomyces roridus TaxID=1738132 RepID=A0AAD7CFE4_9AGAR|nr:hypothetical protein FB45DRAFT_893417 [Roridomyces roridus]